MYIVTYPAGCYGRFVGWTLQWMQGNYPVDYRPFTDTKNSHNWNGIGMQSIKEAVSNAQELADVHYVDHKTNDTMSTNVEKLLGAYSKVILIHPVLEDFIWSCNNKVFKIYKSIDNFIDDKADKFDYNLDKWKSQDPWACREFLSIWLYNQHMAETAYKDVVDYKNNRVFKVQINQIRDNFNDTFTELAKWLGIENVRTGDELTKLHADWVQNEPYLYKDRLIENIVDAIINEKVLEMNELTIVDESQIQHRLRNAGYEIKCHGLNEWPKTTTQLRELIYKI